MGTSRFRVFLSAVSSEFATARSAIASDLRSRGIEVKVQDDFRQEADSDTTLQKLHDYIRDCCAVVALVGRRSGSVPPPAANAPFGHVLPEGFGEASYTQWEVFFALHYRKRLSLYRASETYAPSKPEPAGEDHPQLQAALVAHLFKTLGRDRTHFSTHHEARAEVLKEDWPSTRGPVVLPTQSLGALFKGREAFLDNIRTSLDAADTQATAIVTSALHGLGGVGKTRAAIEYAWRYGDDYSAVLFVPAETPTLLHQNLAALTGPKALNLPEQAIPDEAEREAATVKWLADHDGWLLILDNIDTSEARAAVRGVLARIKGGHVLLTSRLSDWSGGIQSLAMGTLAIPDATHYLLETTADRRHPQPTDDADARRLAVDLDGLAVALEQASAYVRRKRISLAAYLERWYAQAREVQGWYDPVLMQYPRSVAVTWQTTLDQLGAGELALLRLLAWFAPEPLPLFALEGESAAAVWREATTRLSASEVPAGPLIDALGTLADYSLVTWNTGAQTISMHRVLQEVLRTRLDESESCESLRLSLRLLEALLPGSPDDVRTWAVWDPLRPHVLAAVQHGDRWGVADPTGSLMANLGSLLSEKSLYAEAEALERRALAINEGHYGVDHPTVASHLNNLATTLQAMNRLAEAEPLIRRALAIDQASYHADHPNVARGLSNLAQLLKATNRLVEAEPLMRRTLALGEASYGADHPVVAVRLSNLAQLLQATNRIAEAEPLIRRALAIDEAGNGADSPRVAIRLNNLAQLLYATNRQAEAEPLIWRALAIDEASYGADHPTVAMDLNNLAAVFHAMNRLDEAELLLRRALTIDETSYGANHPRVATVLNALAGVLRDTSRLAEAEPLMRRALTIEEASYGADHPRVSRVLNNLAQLFQATNRVAEAEPLLRRALAVDEGSYGPDHPTVAIRLNNLGQLFKATDRLSEAEPLMRRAFKIFLDFTSRSGHEHPNLRVARQNYAELLAAMGHSDAQIREVFDNITAGT